MKSCFAFLLLAGALACNTAPPTDYAGLYYPAGKSGDIDSSELLRVARLDSNAYVFSVSGNSGVGKADGDVVTGELRGPRFGKTGFTFLKGKSGRYEFRAFSSVVQLVKLSQAAARGPQ
ncbi:MAG: hypothetical protein EOO16_02330 [Chitinophagaceae bacterium]|nr:MAG: hypothetical protein EOO16_02330 [Chitinophagaceae bacterium]